MASYDRVNNIEVYRGEGITEALEKNGKIDLRPLASALLAYLGDDDEGGET